jgi:hypothetical protein
MANDPATTHPRVTQIGEDKWVSTSSGDPVVDALEAFLFHATGDLLPPAACRIADAIKELLIDDEDAIEMWGIRLTVETQHG